VIKPELRSRAAKQQPGVPPRRILEYDAAVGEAKAQPSCEAVRIPTSMSRARRTPLKEFMRHGSV